jgi:hypothetical protein
VKISVINRVGFAFVALFVVLTSGCGKVKNAADRSKKQNDLKHIGLLYQNYQDTNNKPPANADDLARMAMGDPQAGQAVQLIRSGNYVVYWGTYTRSLQQNPGGAGGVILGYERDAPTSGGAVMMGDGSTKIMTATEFQSAPKAQGK